MRSGRTMAMLLNTPPQARRTSRRTTHASDSMDEWEEREERGERGGGRADGRGDAGALCCSTPDRGAGARRRERGRTSNTCSIHVGVQYTAAREERKRADARMKMCCTAAQCCTAALKRHHCTMLGRAPTHLPCTTHTEEGKRTLVRATARPRTPPYARLGEHPQPCCADWRKHWRERK